MALYVCWLLMLTLTGVALSSFFAMYNVWNLQHTIENLVRRKINQTRVWPKVSIIVPFHNEQDELKRAMTSLCSLDYDNYEIIAVDDRSSDAGNAIVSEFVKKCSNLKLITIDSLPNHWLGKPHALHQGLLHATGDYILFTDADVVFEATVLRRAIDYMISDDLGHLTLSPTIETTNFTMKMLMPFLLYIMLMAMMPWRVKNLKMRDAVGIGAFNCVSRKALDTIGGVSHLALNPIDDVGLARQLKRHSIKQGIANPEHLLKLKWYSTLQACKIGFEKNIFAFFDFSLIKSTVALIGFLLFIFLPIIILPLSHRLSFIMSSISIINVYLAIRLVCHQLKTPKKYALLYPIAALITLYIGIRSVSLCFLRQGIYWGGVFFPLKSLVSFYKLNKYQ
jgi:glycosyltransferase involved in cell wall biosynthesis